MGPLLSKPSDDLSHTFADFYALTGKANNGSAVDFSAYRGKVVVCVNVARE